jgi:ubiquinone/menaquinone biosynthesis C-methylase UbiE
MQTVDRSYFPLRPGQRVLDLGCGEGRHVINLAAVEQVDAVGVDLSLDDLATARTRLGEFRQMLADADTTVDIDAHASSGQATLFGVLAGDALRLPFADNSFDGVICSEVLEHIPDYRAALREIQRVLRPGGYFFASVPRAWCERICWRLSREYHQTPGGHLRIFAAPVLRGEIEQCGFECYHEHGAHALHTIYWWLQCLFWRRRERSWLVRQYHRLLVWDMMKAPWLTRRLERALNPFLGKSVAMYFRKAPIGSGASESGL